MIEPEFVDEFDDVEALLGDDHERFEELLGRDAAGPVAVVGDPYGGRQAVLDVAADRLDARRIRLGGGDDVEAATEAVGDGPVVVGGCEGLYTRTVGGFERLEAFVDALAGTEATTVTGWNRFAWSYLDAVRDVGAVVPERLDVAGLPADRLETFVAARTGPLPTFRHDETSDDIVALRRLTLEVADRSVAVPVPVPDRRAIAARREDDADPRSVVFDRLAAVSGGNPGAALAVWEGCVDEVVRPGDIEAPRIDADLDRETAFLLRIVLATERVERAALAERFGWRLDRRLASLARTGVLTVDAGVIRLSPAGVPAAAAATDWRDVL